MKVLEVYLMPYFYFPSFFKTSLAEGLQSGGNTPKCTTLGLYNLQRPVHIMN